MVMVYKRKTNRGVGGQYSADDLVRAVRAVKGGISTHAASKTYGVPRSTLMLHLRGWKGRPPATVTRSGGGGRQTDLTQETEEHIATLLRTMSRWGFALTCNETLDTVQDFVKSNGLRTRLKNDRPSDIF